MHRVSTLVYGVRRTAVGTALGIALLTVCACNGPAKVVILPLWKPAEWRGDITRTPQAIGSQTVEINVAQLQPPANKKISLSLPSTGDVIAVLTDYEVVADKQFVWRGAIEGDAGSAVTLSVIESKVVGSIVTSGGKIFSIRFLGKGVSLVEELDPAKFPREEGAGQIELYRIPDRLEGLRLEQSLASGQLKMNESAPLTEQGVLIDVMVLYTAAAAAFETDQDAVTAKINLIISDTNKSYEYSEVNQRIRLAHVEQTGYQEKSSIGLDWDALWDSSNNVHLVGLNNLRSTHEADIVVLITKPALENESCGVAKQMKKIRSSFCTSAFAVVPINCATSKYSFAHELGHLMGADHNNEGGTSTSGPPFQHSRGYVSPSNSWHTIMAYPTDACVEPNCERILRWSNPAVSYPELSAATTQASQPEPTGSDVANNSSSLIQSATTVAQFSDVCTEQPGPAE